MVTDCGPVLLHSAMSSCWPLVVISRDAAER